MWKNKLLLNQLTSALFWVTFFYHNNWINLQGLARASQYPYNYTLLQSLARIILGTLPPLAWIWWLSLHTTAKGTSQSQAPIIWLWCIIQIYYFDCSCLIGRLIHSYSLLYIIILPEYIVPNVPYPIYLTILNLAPTT